MCHICIGIYRLTYAVRDTHEYSGTHREYSKLHLHVDAVKVLNSNSAKVIFWLGRGIIVVERERN